MQAGSGVAACHCSLPCLQMAMPNTRVARCLQTWSLQAGGARARACRVAPVAREGLIGLQHDCTPWLHVGIDAGGGQRAPLQAHTGARALACMTHTYMWESLRGFLPHSLPLSLILCLPPYAGSTRQALGWCVLYICYAGVVLTGRTE